jgi:hypothetical protein
LSGQTGGVSFSTAIMRAYGARFGQMNPVLSFGMTILKQAAFSIAFAVLAVAVVKYGMWILEQKGWISP